MDRIEFSNRINLQGDNFALMILQFFNQEMLLYNMVDTIDDITVINNDTTNISFKLSYKNPAYINALINKIIASPQMIIYDRKYSVSYNVLSNKDIEINITE